MKKTPLLILLLLAMSGVMAQIKTIVNPAYEVKNSGIYNVAKIERTSKDTRVYVHCTFLPNWPVTFTKENFIRVSGSDKKMFASQILKGEFNKEINMPASGDSTFVLIFPALSTTARKIDWGDGEQVFHHALSLDSKKQTAKKNDIPAPVQAWITEELSKARIKKPVDYRSSGFFSNDTARLIGYIKGYDRRLGFSTGIIYAFNEITNEDFPLVINIHSDGRFELNLPLNYPKYTYGYFNEQVVNFYLEPGRSLAMILDWDEFLKADRFRNIRYELKNIKYQGPLAQINSDINSLTLGSFDYSRLESLVNSKTAVEFKSLIMSEWKTEENRLEEELNKRSITTQAKAILQQELAVTYANALWEFALFHRHYSRQDTLNKVLKVPVDPTYYSFLHQLNLNDPVLFTTSGFYSFISRYELSYPFSNYGKPVIITPFYTYLFEDLKIKASAEDLEFVEFKNGFYQKAQESTTGEAKLKLFKEDSLKTAVFEKKYSTFKNGYYEKFPSQEENYTTKKFLKDWAFKDSVLNNYYKLPVTLVHEVAKVRSLKEFAYSKPKREDALMALDLLRQGIKTKALKEELATFFDRSFPEEANKAYELPASKSTEVFKNIIDRYKGKMVFVDFWGIFCGPCINAIEANKATRESYKGSKDVEFIFITSDKESPKDLYDEFVNKQALQNTYRLSQDDYHYLRELFKFNAIPRYVVVDKNGNVINDNFEMQNFEYQLKKLLGQSKG